jgi:hypothetical protein
VHQYLNVVGYCNFPADCSLPYTCMPGGICAADACSSNADCTPGTGVVPAGALGTSFECAPGPYPEYSFQSCVSYCTPTP